MTVSDSLGRATGPGAVPWRKLVRRIRLAAAGALDRLVPPHPAASDEGLPPEWFRYPPF